ncbi:hypothetical protein BKA58DRAFT_37101 [Alternaria rosae]|uniref:uncharacterized protein n=1 Tax=Alternaria rosae TaxID=1187941 RepID=UPI001E8DF1F6|nr:uncharacterized protein BKA58DRAFT_37101 [Alternaria rosae]KAH6860634.1 hypothetical protein BKA58DRAFT_37101 [Alternaria rosae]
MATAEIYQEPTSSPFPSTPSRHQMSPATAMSSTPSTPTPTPSSRTSQSTYTPAQLEARAILTQLLTRLSQLPVSFPDNDKTRPYHKYALWISQHSISILTQSIYSLIRPQVWHLLSSRLSLDALKHLGGDLRQEGRAIYLNGILGVDKRLRIYVGQSSNLRVRVAQHLNFRYRRDHPSLHYYALEWSIYNVFGVLAVFPSGGYGNAVPGMDDPTLLLNVLEMWMCLVFRSLPENTLKDWLPDDVLIDKKRLTAKEGIVSGLNVASPLDQGVEMKERKFVDLSEEDDPVIQDYLKEVQRKRGDGLVGEPVKEKNTKDVEVDEERALRKKMYAEKARRYQRRDTDIVVPQWVFLGAVAIGVGIMLLRSGGGPQARGRWR